MRIAVWHNLPSGGGKRALFGHVQGLVDRGHHVECWCPSTADQTYLPLSQLCPEQVLEYHWQPVERNGRLRWLTAEVRDIRRRLQAMDAHCRRCAEQIHQGDFDLLFANTSQFFHTTSIGAHVKLPAVLYLQEPARRLYEAWPDQPWLAPNVAGTKRQPHRKLWRYLADYAFTMAARIQMRAEVENARAYRKILVNSYYSRESVLRAYGIEATVCYLGVDCDKFSPQDGATGDYVLGLGLVYHLKGLDRAISALARIDAAQRPRLLWIGNEMDPGYGAEMEQMARACGVELEIRVRVTDEQLIQALQAAKLLLYLPRLEPFGYAPLEANACGVPVVGLAEGGLRETIRHGVNGLLVRDNRPEQIAAAVLSVLADPARSRSLRQSARAYVVANWDLKAATDRLEAQLYELAGVRRAANPQQTPAGRTTEFLGGMRDSH